MFRFIVLDMNYPHLYLSELYIRAINDSDSNRAALNQMKITLTLYEVTIQESKITSYPARIVQTSSKTESETVPGLFGVTKPPNPTRFLSIFELKIFSGQFRKTVKPIDPTNLSDFAKISDILEFIKLK